MIKRLEVTRPKGINSELSPYELANDVWSSGSNVSFRNYRTNRILGYSQVFPVVSEQALFVIPAIQGTLYYWNYATATAIYRTEGSTVTDISKAGGYSATFNEGWSGSIFNGVVVMNNNVDAPQYFNAATSQMEDLTAWPTDYTAAAVRPFKNFLIALNITDDAGENFRDLVRWSNVASAGNVPPDWNSSDPASQAGQNALSQTGGTIVDGLSLRDTFIIYKDSSVYGMQFTGGGFVFSFRLLFDDIGMLAKDCVAEFDGRHFVVGLDDIYIHDGSTKKSVIANKFTKEFYTQVNEDYAKRVKVVSDPSRKEIWVYFPTVDSTDGTCNRALLWNWETDTWTSRDIDGISYIAQGVIDPQSSDQWDDATTTWDSATRAWGESSFNPTETDLLLANYTEGKFYRGNTDVVLNAGSDDVIIYTSKVERLGLDFGDNLNYKFVSRIIPHFIGEGVVNVSVGGESRQGEGVRWSNPVAFTIDSDYKADFRFSDRYLAIKFEGETETQWALTGYTIEYEEAGER